MREARKIFSVPLNPKLTQEQFIQFYNFCQQYKDWIADIYFTSRIAPFSQDAMGDVFILEQDNINAIETALNIQQHLDIKVSATFNNIQVPPTQKNLDIFIANFKKLYDAGVRAATIPHTHWLATGQLKAAFPDLYVKNTILRDVATAQEVVSLAKYGFDYINLDRDLMRNKDALLQIKKAKAYIKETLGKDITISLLANEGCLGACPMMVEHFEFNNNRTEKTPQYFTDPISRVSCPKWDVDDPAVPLKTANFSPWFADWEEYLDELGVDVFKMHGREDVTRLFETMELIARFANGEEFSDGEFNNWCEETELAGRPIEMWRDKIRNCKFECWECQYCDKIYDRKADLDFTDLMKHTVNSIHASGVPTVRLDIPGLTSPRVQTLLNQLAKGVGSYMEVGSYLGATAAAALKGNSLNAVFIDHWSENIQPATDGKTLPPTSKEDFLKNIEPYAGKSNIHVFDDDMFNFPTKEFANSIQLLFYDGPHDYETTKQAIINLYSTLMSEAIVVIDDANWEGVVAGAMDGLIDSGAQISYQKLILNEEEDVSQWWNGVYILVIKK